MNGIHIVFPPPQVSGHNGQELISKNKLDTGKFQWAVREEVLGWIINGVTQCIKLSQDKQIVINTELHDIVRMTKGVPLKKIEKLIGKIRHVATVVSMGNKFMMPVNTGLEVKPRIVWW